MTIRMNLNYLVPKPASFWNAMLPSVAVWRLQAPLNQALSLWRSFPEVPHHGVARLALTSARGSV